MFSGGLPEPCRMDGERARCGPGVSIAVRCRLPRRRAPMNRKPVRATVFFAAAWLAFAVTAASAQSMPSLSGTWKLNFDKSGDRIAGNGAAVAVSERDDHHAVADRTVGRAHERSPGSVQGCLQARWQPGQRGGAGGDLRDRRGQVRRRDAGHYVAAIVFLACRRRR